MYKLCRRKQRYSKKVARPCLALFRTITATRCSKQNETQINILLTKNKK